MTGALLDVAKKSNPKKRPGPAPNPEGRRSSLVTMKCHDSWKAWLVKFSKASRTTPSSMIDLALAELAKARGFEEPPER